MDRFVVRKKPASPFLPDPSQVIDPTEARATVEANSGKDEEKIIQANGKDGVFTPEFRASVATYARQHGSRAAVRHFAKFNVRYTSVPCGNQEKSQCRHMCPHSDQKAWP